MCQAAAMPERRDNAVHRADSLESVVKGLDSYKPVANVTVTFASTSRCLQGMIAIS